MMHLGPADRFVAGAVGEPGDRTFLIEVEAEGRSYWYLLEKQQVAVLAQRVIELLREAGHDTSSAHRVRLSDPGDVAFRVGEIRMAYAAIPATVTITLLPGGDDEDLDGVEFDATAEQLYAMAVHAQEAVLAGRPPCPRCALPMDPDGHVCPASNGDLRRHRG